MVDWAVINGAPSDDLDYDSDTKQTVEEVAPIRILEPERRNDVRDYYK